MNNLNMIHLLEGSPIATFVLDHEHQVVCWNHACEVITKVSAQEVLNTKDAWKGFYKTSRPVLADLILDNRIDDAMVRYEKGHCKPSLIVKNAYEAEGFFPETGKWLYFTASPIFNEKGEKIGAMETLQDITEKKQAEVILVEMNKKLEEKVDEKYLELNDIKGQLQYASSAAMTAMSSMGEMGVLIEALRKFNNCEHSRH